MKSARVREDKSKKKVLQMSREFLELLTAVKNYVERFPYSPDGVCEIDPGDDKISELELFLQYAAIRFDVQNSRSTHKVDKQKMMIAIAGILKAIQRPKESYYSFDAAEHFKVDNTAGVKFGKLGENFVKYYGSKVEEYVPRDKKLSFWKPYFGGDYFSSEDVEYQLPLAYVWRLLEKQPNGEDGDLLINGYANLFYVTNCNENVSRVVVTWKTGKWNVDNDGPTSMKSSYDGRQFRFNNIAYPNG